MDFAKPVKAISLPQDVLSTSEHYLIELKNQVQRLMEAYLAPKSFVQVNKITSSCDICSGPHDTQYCMENPKQAFVDYTNLKGLVSSFMASQDTRLSKFKVDFKQQQGVMTNKIDTVLKAINDRITGTLPSDTINAITMCSKQPNKSHNDQPQDHDTIAEECKTLEEEGKEEKGDPKNIITNLPSPPDPSISFITE
ncbi:hypothetical protein Tco_0662010 [Tanacetum coccineum]